ncbi:MAG: hypothetical protein NVSMB38_40370 [Ktedonobacteraceae bacterium]
MYGKQAFRESVQSLSVNNLWLLTHMVIAFWHTFGISNGMSINPDTDIKTVHYKEGPDGHHVTPQAMQAKLAEYLTWLDGYQASWDTERFNDVCSAEVLLQGILHPEFSSFRLVVDMIERLQIMSTTSMIATHVLLVSDAEGHLDASIATSEEDALTQARTRITFWLEENGADPSVTAPMTIEQLSTLYAQGNDTSWMQIAPIWNVSKTEA